MDVLDWSELPVTAKNLYETLGWDELRWTSKAKIEELAWAELSELQQESARSLGYDQDTWDEWDDLTRSTQQLWGKLGWTGGGVTSTSAPGVTHYLTLPYCTSKVVCVCCVCCVCCACVCVVRVCAHARRGVTCTRVM